MKDTTSMVLGLLGCAIVGAGCREYPAYASSSTPASLEASAVRADPYKLKIKLDGAIAYSPQGCKAQGKGQLCDSVVAVLPRLDRPNRKHLPGQQFHPNFYPDYYTYPLHHAVIKVRARNLLDHGEGDHYVYLALYAENPAHPTPPGPDEAFEPWSYDISFSPAGETKGAVIDSSFEKIPIVYEGLDRSQKLVEATLMKEALIFPLKTQDDRIAARLRFASGETLTAMDLIADTETRQPVPFSYVSRAGCKGVAPHLAKCTGDLATPIPQDEHALASGVAQHVMVERPATGITTMTLTAHDGASSKREYKLVPDAQGLEVEIVNLSAEEPLALPNAAVDRPGLEHFAFYHLLSTRDDDRKHYFYPHPVKKVANGGRPFCTGARFKKP
jgi:hypothetical protein